jgi:hypothetical protein
MSLTPTITSIVLVSFLSYGIYRYLRRKQADSKFGITTAGGRAGSIRISLPQGTVVAEYEVGTKGLIVYRPSFSWEDGQSLSQTYYQKVALKLKSWSASGGPMLEIAGGA